MPVPGRLAAKSVGEVNSAASVSARNVGVCIIVTLLFWCVKPEAADYFREHDNGNKERSDEYVLLIFITII